MRAPAPAAPAPPCRGPRAPALQALRARSRSGGWSCAQRVLWRARSLRGASFRGRLVWPGENNDLTVPGDVHMKATLGDRPERRATGGVANLGLEFHSRCVHRVALSLEGAERPRLADAERPTCYDACSQEQETTQDNDDPWT